MKNRLLFSVLYFGAIFVAKAQTGNVGIGTSIPGSKLTVNGSFAGPYQIVTASGALGANDFYTAYNGGSAGTLTLPAATVASPSAGNFLGRMYHIKNTSAVTVTVAANGTELIDNQSGAGVASIAVSPGYYALFISKGTTGAVTTWEVALVGSANEAARPQILVVDITADNNINRQTSGTSTKLVNDALKVNSIPGASYTASTGSATGYATVPAGTYLVTMVYNGECPGAASASNTNDGLAPTHSFYYDFRFDASSTRRLHANIPTHYGGGSNLSVHLQYVCTITTSRNFPLELGWGQSGNVKADNTVAYGIYSGTQLSIIKVL